MKKEDKTPEQMALEALDVARVQQMEISKQYYRGIIAEKDARMKEMESIIREIKKCIEYIDGNSDIPPGYPIYNTLMQAYRRYESLSNFKAKQEGAK